jgi:hypothetical protein
LKTSILAMRRALKGTIFSALSRMVIQYKEYNYFILDVKTIRRNFSYSNIEKRVIPELVRFCEELTLTQNRVVLQKTYYGTGTEAFHFYITQTDLATALLCLGNHGEFLKYAPSIDTVINWLFETPATIYTLNSDRRARNIITVLKRKKLNPEIKQKIAYKYGNLGRYLHTNATNMCIFNLLKEYLTCVIELAPVPKYNAFELTIENIPDDDLFNMASSAHTPPDVLQTIYQLRMKDREQKRRENDPVIWKVLRNPRCPIQVLQHALTSNLIDTQERRSILQNTQIDCVEIVYNNKANDNNVK